MQEVKNCLTCKYEPEWEEDFEGCKTGHSYIRMKSDTNTIFLFEDDEERLTTICPAWQQKDAE